ncbi:HAMP domain-containing sensor histidine kinase [Tissierella sp. Yu-01]|uniref:sensor histidine kinase n=1 Tax=Tissierella sp. Yu-01 TaxID=3035694 RepID=UPI00240E43F0|nr:HAMP domain-containing sensor histidine kinase [Tissierella sp. Yu-01]WFA09418.1 HAMP domain-containing sensor histidine kinase [Tissierella sp. Yu-01]
MKKSIKNRLVKSFMLIILITVIILEIMLINGIKNYYYKNVETILTNQIEFSTNFYSRYFSSSSLEDIIIDDIDVFWQHTTAQVQILTLDGKLLMDSLGVIKEDTIKYPDIEAALAEGKGVWSGYVPYDDVPVMSVSMPLSYQGSAIGVIRFISSLEQTNGIIKEITEFLIWMGIFVVLISGLVSLFLANSIIKPLKEVTGVAEKLADGQFKTRSRMRVNDEIGRLANTLNYMADEILRKEQLKNDFISSVSHELRTPLTSIKGWAVTLKADEVPDKELLDAGLDIIEKESDRLTLMVEELLDFSRFTSGRIQLEKEQFNLKNTIRIISRQLEPRAKYNGIDFRVNIDENIEDFIGDENRIKQVFINILDNAFKFTDEGGKVMLNAVKENNDVIIEINDTGIGIPENDLPNVTEKFYKGKNSKSHSGIGLSISDEIVKLHGGILTIDSIEGQGTKVLVRLPIEEIII